MRFFEKVSQNVAKFIFVKIATQLSKVKSPSRRKFAPIVCSYNTSHGTFVVYIM
jgi:hypothetical protein